MQVAIFCNAVWVASLLSVYFGLKVDCSIFLLALPVILVYRESRPGCLQRDRLLVFLSSAVISVGFAAVLWIILTEVLGFEAFAFLILWASLPFVYFRSVHIVEKLLGAWIFKKQKTNAKEIYCPFWDNTFYILLFSASQFMYVLVTSDVAATRLQSQFFLVLLICLLGVIRGKRQVPVLAFSALMIGFALYFPWGKYNPITILIVSPIFLLTVMSIWELAYARIFHVKK